MDSPITREALRSDTSARDETVKLLSDSTRLDVLRTLWEGHDPADPSPMRFAELRERVSVDDLGRLNYHLHMLTPHTVRRNEDGYELEESGKRMIRVLLSGTAIDDPEIEPVVVDVSCRCRGGQPKWSYRDGWRYLACTN